MAMGLGTPPARVPCLQKTPPGTGISIRAVCCHRKYRLTIYIPGRITTCNLRSSEVTDGGAYKALHFYKYAFSSITIGVRDREQGCKNRYQ